MTSPPIVAMSGHLFFVLKCWVHSWMGRSAVMKYVDSEIFCRSSVGGFSCGPAISPTSCSTMSSSVIRPAVPPYSSTAIASVMPVFLKCVSSASDFCSSGV